ncbi:MAG: TetR/AcrR family transcriptional regulator [Gammaproteobacteria bacterium]|nr:TetR/AcrR family transcriptional regulator [Gammaproteobacteria bacterium]
MAAGTGKRTVGRRRRNDPQGLRARILDQAARLFQERGYHSTSMHDLMHETGVSAGALHHHFPTKKSLALAVLADRVRPVVREAWIDPVRNAPALGKGVAEAFGSIIDGMQPRKSVLGCPLNNLALELALTDADLRRGVDSIFAEWRAALVERIGGTRGGARLDESGRAAAANFVISVYSGAMNMAKAAQSTAPLADAFQLLTHWMNERHLAS